MCVCVCVCVRACMHACMCVSGACGIYQNSMYGVAAFLPMKYTNAIIFGNVSSPLQSVFNVSAVKTKRAREECKKHQINP